MLAAKLGDGNVEFTPKGKSAIKRIFSILDSDKSGGLSYQEMVHFFAKTEPDFPFTRRTFDGLGVETLANNKGDISIAGFETFYRCMLESDFDLGIKRLEADLVLFEQDNAMVMVIMDEEDEPQQPEPKKQKKDAFAEMLQSRKQAPAVGTKRQVAAAKKPTKAAMAVVEKPKPVPFEEIDLTSRDSLPSKPVHPFFQPKAAAKLVVDFTASDTTTTTMYPPVELLDFPLLPIRQSLPPLPPPRRQAFTSTLLPPSPTISTSILGKDIWTTHEACNDDNVVVLDEENSNSQVAVVESELWTEKYKCTRSTDLICTQKSRIQSFLTGWLESRQQQRASRGAASSSSEEDDEDLAWPNNTTPELPENEKHILLLYGPNGCGKTFPVHLIAKELGFRVLEVNASDDLLQIEKLHGQATQNYGLQQSKNSKLAMPLILLDEFDCEFETKHEEQTAAIKRFALRAKCPVVLITCGKDLPKQWSTNNWSVDRVRNFNIECVKCEMPSMERVAGVLEHVISKENLNMVDPLQLATLYGGDLRRCLNHIQFGLKCGAAAPSNNSDLYDDKVEFDGIPNLDILCPFPRIDSVSSTGSVVGYALQQESSVYLSYQQQLAFDCALDGSKLQLHIVQNKTTVTAITEQEEEDEMFEDTPQRNLFRVQNLNVVNEWLVGGRYTLLRQSNSVLIAANEFAPVPSPTHVKQTAVVDPVDVEAARRNLRMLQALSNKLQDVDNEEEENDDQLKADQAKLQYWFTEFIRDRASFTCEVPFVVSMCRLEEEAKLKMPSNRRGERKRIVKHFRGDLEWVDTERTALQFTIPHPSTVTAVKTKRRLVESNSD